jgi:hypothetical protein
MSTTVSTLISLHARITRLEERVHEILDSDKTLNQMAAQAIIDLQKRVRALEDRLNR